MITIEIWTIILLYCYPADNLLSLACRKSMIACYRHEKNNTISQDFAITKCIESNAGLNR